MGTEVFSFTGPKHCGKTLAAKTAAQDSGGLFIDLDVLLEELSGLTARDLFLSGEKIFRDTETRAVQKARELASQSGAPVFIAAGGGIIDNQEAFGMLKDFSLVLYFEVSADTAWKRIEKAAEQGGGWPAFLKGPDPRKLHRELHERRAALYRKAALHIITAEDKTPAELSGEIRALLTNR
ncbi:MAG: shikimate kinase [Spirochaetaceae bacterium]|jgi:shikimate kinase|nr:shikimate kinase [Spirochaetaceae bacterium]